MRFPILVLVGVLMQAMPVSAQELNSLSMVSGGDMVTEAVSRIVIPDVTGMIEAEAVATLEAVELPGGSCMEIVKKYEYSGEVAKDMVYAQTLAGEVTVEEAASITITISMGAEPQENLLFATMQAENNMGSFGIAADITADMNQTSYRLLDWDSLPCSYEFNHDNSASCWYYGCWADVDGDGVPEMYKTPEGTYDNNVRHKVQVHCDGEFVYLHIKMATIFGSQFNGDYYVFDIDGQRTNFSVQMGDRKITGDISGMETGTYQVEVRHGNNSMSSTDVPGSEAYFTKYENNLNSEVELKIPLAELKRQNDRIDFDNMNEIGFFTNNLTGDNVITASGASTFPMGTAVAALVLIPGSTVLIKKKFRKNKKEANE